MPNSSASARADEGMCNRHVIKTAAQFFKMKSGRDASPEDRPHIRANHDQVENDHQALAYAVKFEVFLRASPHPKRSNSPIPTSVQSTIQAIVSLDNDWLVSIDDAPPLRVHLLDSFSHYGETWESDLWLHKFQNRGGYISDGSNSGLRASGNWYQA